MTVTAKIAEYLENLPPGEIFTYDQLNIQSKEFQAAAKAIQRNIEANKIKRLKNGTFYKPRNSIFGSITPSEEDIIKTYLYENGKRVAYITGLSLYNRLGLTTQVPSTIKIASRSKRISINIPLLKAKSSRAYAEVTEKNVVLLELLDAIKDFAKIPDLDKATGLKILSSKIRALNKTDVERLLRYALVYPPRCRALLGAILENEKLKPRTIDDLLKSLNPFSEFNFEISTLLPNADRWRIR